MRFLLFGVQRLAAAIRVVLIRRQACGLQTALFLALMQAAIPAQVARGVRSLPSSAQSGDAITAVITLETDVYPFAVTERLPSGWEVLSTEPEAVNDSRDGSSLQEGVLTWVVLEEPDADVVRFLCVLRVPENANGTVSFNGDVQFGYEAPHLRTGGATTIEIVSSEIGSSITVWGFDINAWELLGIIATFVFASRFLVQWVASERSGRSVVPTVFWWLSLIGAAGLLAYGIHFRRLAVVLGQSFGFIVYIRNLMLIRKDRRLNGAAKSGE
jgi:lipid-A-disaccharide synthase-like uncharacterized protein